MRQLNKKEKMLAAGVVILLFIFMFNSLIITPFQERLSKAGQDIKQAQLLIRKNLELEQKKDSLLKENKRIERYLTLKGSDDEKMTVILSRIEAEARKAGLIIIDMKPEAAAQKTKSLPIVYRIQLNAEAELSKAFNFVYNLENAEILFKFDKLNLSVKDETTGVMKIEATILGIAIA
jgi:hypothetical protein